ncbi:MAG: HEAT repeat domain-containing protein [Phycisphaerales bacterium]|nr:HEAT repeat domain-containing protein [Phycisphaerales bacterium]
MICVSDLACAPGGQSYRAGIQSERTTDRIRAIYKAGELRDPLAVALLVDRLEDEDEGVRLYAFLALERITGKRFDYDYAATPSARALAVDRWRAYVRERYAAGSPPFRRSPGGEAN